MKESQAIKEPILREVLQAGGRVRAVAAGCDRGFALKFEVGTAEKLLVTARGTTRLFASLDTVASLVEDLGIASFEVDMTKYRRGRLRGPRPDRAEALRHTRTRLQQQPLEFSDVEARI